MVFKQNLIAVVKQNGKILREVNNTGEPSVYLPYGSEYSLLFKNKDSKRVVVTIEIDGQDVLHGNRIVIPANSEYELERFLESMDSGARFKFIQKTEKITNHRGDKIDDGIIRIEYWYEENVWRDTWKTEPFIIYQFPPIPNRYYVHPYPSNPWSQPAVRYSDTSVPHKAGDVQVGSSGAARVPMVETDHSIRSSKNADESIMMNCCLDNSFDSQQVKADEGITVPGSNSNQSFEQVQVGDLEQHSHTICLKLRGFVEGQPGKNTLIKKPVTVKTKVTCPTCGSKYKAGVKKFCAECGTSLAMAPVHNATVR